MNNPTLGESCLATVGRADIEGSKSDVAMNAWPPQASYPCGNFSDTSRRKSIQSRGSWGLAFALATLSSRGAIKPAFTFMVYASFRSTLSRSWDTRVSIRRVYRPSQTPHPVVVLSSRDALREALDSTQRLSGLNAAGFRPLIRELVNGRRS